MVNNENYEQSEVVGMDELSLEVRALVKSSSIMNKIRENWQEQQGELFAALEKNRRLWSYLMVAMLDEKCQHPVEVRTNIVNLANFVFKRTNEVLFEPSPDKIGVLVDINLQIANGLSGKSE